MVESGSPLGHVGSLLHGQRFRVLRFHPLSEVAACTALGQGLPDQAAGQRSGQELHPAPRAGDSDAPGAGGERRQQGRGCPTAATGSRGQNPSTRENYFYDVLDRTLSTGYNVQALTEPCFATPRDHA